MSTDELIGFLKTMKKNGFSVKSVSVSYNEITHVEIYE